MKICVVGNSNKLAMTETAIQYANILIEHSKKYNHTILNGGCNGMMEYINKKANDVGIKLKIYSPAKNINEHIELYNYEIKDASYIFEFNDKPLGYRFINRSLPLIEDADIVFVFYGMWGTLSELTFATMLGKKIVFLIEYNKHQLIDVYKLLSDYNNYDYKEEAVYIKTPNELETFLKEI